MTNAKDEIGFADHLKMRIDSIAASDKFLDDIKSAIIDFEYSDAVSSTYKIESGCHKATLTLTRVD